MTVRGNEAQKTAVEGVINDDERGNEAQKKTAVEGVINDGGKGKKRSKQRSRG